jgi:hypothetical protein
LKLKIHRPPAYLHFAVADRITDGWKLQLASARRYHSEHLLNLASLPQPFRFAMKMECLKAMLPQSPPKTVLVMLDAMDVLFNNSLDASWPLSRNRQEPWQGFLWACGLDSVQRRKKLLAHSCHGFALSRA